MIGNIAAGLYGVGVTPSTSSFESIATISVGAGGASNIEFTSIGSGYKHLQIRGIYRQSDSDSAPYINLTFNNDTGSNYAAHALTGTGSAAIAQAYTSAPAMYVQTVASDFHGTSVFSGLVIDVLDYGSTSKNKTTRSLVGIDNNGGGFIRFNSGLWMSTSAVTSIKFTPSGGSIKQYSTLALYGIKD